MSTSQRRILLTMVAATAMVLLSSPGGRAAAPPLEISAASDAVRVFEDGYGWTGGQAGEIRVFGLRNEILSAQCAVLAHENLEDLTVDISPLQHTAGSAALSADAVQWSFVDSIFIEENTPKLVKSDLTRPAPARFPDVLSDQRQCSVAQGSLKAVYLTIRIPRDIAFRRVPRECRGAARELRVPRSRWP